ncbi:hypothetical protein [Aquimarina sp. I32.4]|uniref:hypothetical protein n=1 Tax=Aquimarina sp. I32.4 TaxID=2053903 RepID=UPI000CDE9AF5|nr:hypothetical protein [Aquimarina sp. I32.4]
MIKKIITLFKRRQYLNNEQKKLFESDLKKELEKVEKKVTNQYKKYKRKNMEIRVLREILEESEDHYTESEINSLYHIIINETQKH